MAVRNRLVHRVVGLFVRWGLVKHPYGREYARRRYTATGRRVQNPESRGVTTRVSPLTGAALIGVALLLLSALAAGVLVAS